MRQSPIYKNKGESSREGKNPSKQLFDTFRVALAQSLNPKPSKP